MQSVKKVINILLEKKLSIATVESCSAGYLSYLLKTMPGSSMVFKGGIIAYSLEAKYAFFKLPITALKRNKGVSQQIATKLAKGVKRLFSAKIGTAIVGFAGPTARKGIKPGTIVKMTLDVVKRTTEQLNRRQQLLVTLDLRDFTMNSLIYNFLNKLGCGLIHNHESRTILG